MSNRVHTKQLFSNCNFVCELEYKLLTCINIDLYFVSSAPTHYWVSYSNLTHATLANTAYMWFLAHAISAIGTRSLQPEKTQRTTANSRHTTLRVQPFSRTYCGWRCVRNVRVSNLDTLWLHYRSELWDHPFYDECLNYLNFNSVIDEICTLNNVRAIKVILKN